jgi:hypothetical protein
MSGQFHTPTTSSPEPTGQEARWTPEPVRMLWRKKNLSPAGNQTLAVQPIAHHYTNSLQMYTANHNLVAPWSFGLKIYIFINVISLFILTTHLHFALCLNSTDTNCTSNNIMLIYYKYLFIVYLMTLSATLHNIKWWDDNKLWIAKDVEEVLTAWF